MPKHGWKWRTERLRAMSREELGQVLNSKEGVTAKLARWAYRHLATGEHGDPIQIFSLEAIAHDERTPWVRQWLWNELERRKGEWAGDWIVIALTRCGVQSWRNAMPFIQLYEDRSAHPDTRGSALFGLSNAVGCARQWREFDEEEPTLSEADWERISQTCQAALGDETNAYARAGACWLAGNLGGFVDELRRLTEDHTRSPGGPVSDYAQDGLWSQGLPA